MARRPFISGNWKLNLGPAEAAAVAADLVPLVADRGEVDVVLFPTALSVTRVLESVQGSGVEIGVQCVHSSSIGAFTGANSAVLARQAGCAWTLAGHSERRHVFGETDEEVGGSVRAALQAGLLVVLCVGETLEQRQSNELESVVGRQLETGLAGLHADQVATVVVAYEPVWAIGTGLTASPAQAQDVHAFIRGWLADRYPAFVAEDARILYGGSVMPANAAELLGQPDIDGVLVGGASLKADVFSQIVGAAS